VIEQRSPTRRRQAVANDATLQAASLAMLAERGLDLFSFSDLAREVGLTRAPIYARFDSPEDVAIELWSTVLEGEVQSLLDLTRGWHTGRDEIPSERLRAAISSPSLELCAVVEVLAVARRFPSLQDIVSTSMERLLTAYVAAQPAPRAIALSQVAVALGAVFLAPFLGPTGRDGWTEPLTTLRSMFADRSIWNVVPIEAEPYEIPIGGSATGDPLFDEFLPAINTVIARTGYEHATATRISREAGRAFSLLYEHFDSKESLMERVAHQWVDAGVRLSLAPFVGVSPDEYLVRSVATARSLTADRNRAFRNHRNEMVLAARHHPAIGRDTARRYRRAADAGRALFEEHYVDVTDETMREIALIGTLVRANGFGLCLLASTMPTISDVEWTPASTALQREIWRRVISRLTPRH